MHKCTILMLCCGLVATGASAQRSDCPLYVKGNIGGDYNNSEHRLALPIVEQFHFTPAVEHLQRGASGPLGSDISYTLEHFPNHPRALTAIARLAIREKSAIPLGARFSVECYFDRAIRFQPEDAAVRAVFGGYLLVLKQDEAALEQLKIASQLAPDDAANHYNLGLLYLRRKNYEQARAAAKVAYDQGFPLPGLKNKLVAAGQWKE